MARRIGILQFLTPLDEVVAGFKEGLTELGYAEGPTVVYEYRNVDGNAADLPVALGELVAAGVELVLACATPSAKIAAAQAGGRPVVFVPVFDPVKAGLVASREAPGGHVTGISGMVLPNEKLPVLRQLLPKARRLGLLYNPGDPNASTEADAILVAGAAYGFEVAPVTIQDAAQIDAALADMVSGVDVILVSLDRVIDEHLDRVIAATKAAKVPLVAHNAPGVKRGAFCAIEAPPFQLGRQAARQAAQIMAGVDPGTIPVGFPESTRLVVNEGTAAAIGVDIPADVRPDLTF